MHYADRVLWEDGSGELSAGQEVFVGDDCGAGEGDVVVIFLLRGDLGDQITMLPALKTYHDDLGIWKPTVYMCARELEDLIPAYSWRVSPSSIDADGVRHVVVPDIWKMMERYANVGKTVHPARLFFAYLGMGMPDEVPRPEVSTDFDATWQYEYVIAPFANDPARAMPEEMLRDLVCSLSGAGFEGTVAVVGGAHDDFGAIPRVLLHEHTVVTYRGRSLSYIAGLMRRAKYGVVTVDSMANRLAHAADVEKHVLCCADVVPREWVEYPGVRMVYGKREEWTVRAVLDALVM